MAVFKDNVRASHGLQTADNALPRHYLNWIATKFEPNARTVYDGLPEDVKADWARLEPALSNVFTDENEKLEFLSKTDSFKRAPDMTLREYRDELQRRMNKYQPELRNIQAEFNRSAVQRFREGLRDMHLAAHIMMQCKGVRETLENALETAIAWETTMKHFVRKDQDTNERVTPLMSTMLGIPTATMASLYTPASIRTVPQQATTSLEDLKVKFKEQELNIAELKAAQALTNDRIGYMESEESEKTYRN